MKINPNGVYPTMITPFTDDNKIDYNAVEQLIQWYADRGVAGIFAICQSSEIFFLSFEEKLELLKFIVDKAPKGVSIIASGHTADDIETQIEEAKAICGGNRRLCLYFQQVCRARGIGRCSFRENDKGRKRAA